MTGEVRGFFTRPAGLLLNGGLGCLLLALACGLGGRVAGFPAWGYAAAGVLALFIALSTVRRLRLGSESLLVRGWRARVEMDYAEVDRVEVLRRRATPLARAPVSYAALRAVDGRIAWIAAYDFSFPREAYLELGRRVQAARAGGAELLTGGQDGPAPRRSPLLALLACALLACGLFLLWAAVREGLLRSETRAGGRPGQAEILALEGPATTGEWKLELLGPGGARRSATVQGGWMRGRSRGDRVEILAHPALDSYFVLADEGAERWSAMIPGLIALALFFGGGRLLARALASPIGVLEDLEDGFRGPGTPRPCG